MKIRQAFVSNSSTTSFTLYGVIVPDDKTAYELARDSDLKVTYGDPNDWPQNIYVGLVLSGDFEHWSGSNMRDDETKLEFMERVKVALGEDYTDKVAWYSESFYLG